MFDNDDLIHSYTRAQALADGILVDVSATAREAGFRCPVAVTSAVFERYICVPEGIVAQDLQGRLWDILILLVHSVNRAPEGDMLLFTVFVRNDNHQPEPVKLKAIIGPDDEGAPCVTILLPEED